MNLVKAVDRLVEELSNMINLAPLAPFFWSDYLIDFLDI